MIVRITFEKGIETSDKLVDGNTVEILLGTVYKGNDGKSAYQAAVEGGFKGTEQEFNNVLANPLTMSIEGDI